MGEFVECGDMSSHSTFGGLNDDQSQISLVVGLLLIVIGLWYFQTVKQRLPMSFDKYDTVRLT